MVLDANRDKLLTPERLTMILEALIERQGIAGSLYCSWSKEFLEAGKKRLAGDTARAAASGGVKDLRREVRDMKVLVANRTLENRLLKKA